MCGFAGFHTPRDFPADADHLVARMGDRLQHRGPDASGQWHNSSVTTAIAFRRLAILELSDLGHQPMLSTNGRFALAFNGEIYNHRELRWVLEQHGRQFKGHSDTEVLLAGISEWGLEATLTRCVGMFALALVDLSRRELLLARDRLGEKPLYYGWSGGYFFFGSELKAFRPHRAFAAGVDRSALSLYVRYGYVPSPYCILTGFRKLSPGCILSLSLDGGGSPGSERVRAYWSLPRPEGQPGFRGSPEDSAAELEFLLGRSISLQMLADVPVGAFLSGGIDSSTVVSLMQAQARAPVKTFTIGFPDAAYDESGYAERIAKHLGTEHTTWRCADSELLDLAQLIPRVYCEPFADDSQLPTMALARLARQQVTVSLSGDGGDELFHGYGHYEKSFRRWKQIRRHPELLNAARIAISGLSAPLSLLPGSSFRRRWMSRLGKARNQWLPENLPTFYRHRMSLYKAPDLYLTQNPPAPDFFDDAARIPNLREDVSCLSYIDQHTYLPDDILVKVDRAAMAFSLETRVPLLDHRIVEFAAGIPATWMWYGGKSKWPLRSILQRKVPRELVDRPKMGFSAPIERWLRGPLRKWADAQLAPERLRREAFFNPEEVGRLWHEHQSGSRNRGLMLWVILMFQAWQETF
jgi:asparagine synthase (glutamine-hydrolysing)